MNDYDKEKNNIVFKQNFSPISLRVDQDKYTITQFYYDLEDLKSVDFYQLDIDPSIEQALKLLYTGMFGDDIDDLCCAIWSYKGIRKHRKRKILYSYR